MSRDNYNGRAENARDRGESERTVKLAVIDNSIDPDVYNPREHWSRYLNLEWEAFRATQRQLPDLKKGYTHLLMTGSEASIVYRERWVDEEVELVQEALERGLSILGSCYGHQLLVLALMGPDHVRRSRHPEVGWIPIQIKVKSRLLGKPRQADTFSVHFDEVTGLGGDFIVLASSRDSEVQAFEMKGRPVWGLQIHPEIDIQSAQKLLRKLIAVNLKTRPFFEKALNSTPRDSGLIRQIVKTFLSSGK